MKTIHIFFGEMGSGKSFLGNIFAEENGLAFFEGDSAVTYEMMEKVSQFKPMSREMIDSFVNRLYGRIVREASSIDTDLVVSQALYTNKHRNFLASQLREAGFNVVMYWVRTPWYRNIQYLYSRSRGLGWVYYWAINAPFFEKPSHSYHSLFNNKKHG